MSEQFKYEKKYWYPHLKPADIAIWERFIEKYPNVYETVAYDVAVGEGAPIPAGTEKNLARDFKILTQWKIDVVGFNKNQIDVIEIKPNAGLNALGQVLGYVALFKKTFPDTRNVLAVIITNNLRPDMLKLAEGMGVKLYKVDV